jgi:hypothetical protein
VVVARVSEEMNLANPKSETFIRRDAGFLEEYNRFSGCVQLTLSTLTLISLWMILRE